MACVRAIASSIPERKADPFSNLPRVKVLHGLPGAAPAKDTIAMQWKNADLLEAAIPIAGRETVLNTVEISGQQPVTLPPCVCRIRRNLRPTNRDVARRRSRKSPRRPAARIAWKFPKSGANCRSSRAMSNLRRGCSFSAPSYFCWKFWSEPTVGRPDCLAESLPSFRLKARQPKYRTRSLRRCCLPRLVRQTSANITGVWPSKRRPLQARQPQRPNPCQRSRSARNPHLMRFSRPVNGLIAAQTRICDNWRVIPCEYVTIFCWKSGVTAKQETWSSSARPSRSTRTAIGATLLLGWWVGRRMALDSKTSTLISVGTAICGGLAIAAVSTVIAASEAEIAVSIGTIFLLNAVALYIFPLTGQLAAFEPAQFGLWAGVEIHGIPQWSARA